MAKNSRPTTPSSVKKPPVRPTGRPPVKKAGKSIVNQKQFPWGWAIVAAVLVLFAGGIVAFAVTRSDNGTDSNNPYTHPALADAMAIQGVTYKPEPDHTHVEGTIKYDATPPVGGNHSQYWADCTGTVYAQPIANENGVHMLEHGAVWVTYNATKVDAAGVAALSKLVKGVNGTALSPYPDLDSAVSLQAWGYQLKVNSATDPRIAQFIDVLHLNPATTPEQATCSQPTFITHPSTFGNPLWVPASGQ